MKIIITRPKNDSEELLKQFKNNNLDVEIFPLLEIKAKKFEINNLNLNEYKSIMFVSKNAVDYSQKLIKKIIKNKKINYWAVGPKTAESLKKNNLKNIFYPDDDSQQFDSKNLWKIVKHQINETNKVLIIRGAGIKSQNYLENQLLKLNVKVDFLDVYERTIPKFKNKDLISFKNLYQQNNIWLFFNSEVLINFNQLINKLNLVNYSKPKIIIIHQRIANLAIKLNFNNLIIARPLVSEILDKIFLLIK